MYQYLYHLIKIVIIHLRNYLYFMHRLTYQCHLFNQIIMYLINQNLHLKNHLILIIHQLFQIHMLILRNQFHLLFLINQYMKVLLIKMVLDNNQRIFYFTYILMLNHDKNHFLHYLDFHHIVLIKYYMFIIFFFIFIIFLIN